MQLRPPFAYYGGKIRLARRIVALLPDHRVYVEPFAGSLAVLLAKPPAIHEVVNDRDGHLVNFWRQLREAPDELARRCWATPYARAEYDAALACDLAAVEDDLERARLWWIRVTQSHSRGTATSGWSTGRTRSASRATETRRGAERIPAVARRLRRVTIECRDALETIAAYDDPETVIYADPPYPDQVRNSTGYACEMGSTEAHRRLAEQLHACTGTVLISSYPCPLYEELYGDWARVQWATSRSTGGRARASTTAVETVWANRPLPVQPSLGEGELGTTAVGAEQVRSAGAQ